MMFVAACLAGMTAISAQQYYAPQYRDMWAENGSVWTSANGLDFDRYEVTEGNVMTVAETRNFKLNWSPGRYLTLVRSNSGLFKLTNTREGYRADLDRGILYSNREELNPKVMIYEYPEAFKEALATAGTEYCDMARLFQPRFGSDELIAHLTASTGDELIFVSHDFGKSWILSDTRANLVDVAWSAADPRVVYGVELSRGDTLTLMVSEDGGLTWTELDSIPYRYNTRVNHRQTHHVRVEACPADAGIAVVSCMTPFVYDRNTRTVTMIPDEYTGTIQGFNAYERFNARRYGFTGSAVPQLMTFEAETGTLRVSEDLGKTWRDCLDNTGAQAFKGTAAGWTRDGNMVYVTVHRSPVYEEGTVLAIDLNATDAIAAVESPVADATSVRVTVHDGAIEINADAASDIAVYATDGHEVDRHAHVTTATVTVSPGIYIVTAGPTSRKVTVQ